jgi:hypothetical protein
MNEPFDFKTADCVDNERINPLVRKLLLTTAAAVCGSGRSPAKGMGRYT